MGLPSIGSAGAPGFVPGPARDAVQQGAGNSIQMMQNRYNQLGMGGSTPEMMDVGSLPSYTGGIPEEFQAVMGQLQTAALNNQNNTGGGKGGGKSGAGSAISALGAIK